MFLGGSEVTWRCRTSLFWQTEKSLCLLVWKNRDMKTWTLYHKCKRGLTASCYPVVKEGWNATLLPISVSPSGSLAKYGGRKDPQSCFPTVATGRVRGTRTSQAGLWGGRGQNLRWSSGKQQADEGARHTGAEQGEVAYAWEGSYGVASWPRCWAVGNCQLVAWRVNNYLWILSFGKSWKFLSSRLPVVLSSLSWDMPLSRSSWLTAIILVLQFGSPA